VITRKPIYLKLRGRLEYELAYQVSALLDVKIRDETWDSSIYWLESHIADELVGHDYDA